jgi:hypothetical protein
MPCRKGKRYQRLRPWTEALAGPDGIKMMRSTDQDEGAEGRPGRRRARGAEDECAAHPFANLDLIGARKLYAPSQPKRSDKG